MANMNLPKIKNNAARKDINFFALRKVQKKGLDITIPPWVVSIIIPAVVVAVIASVYIYNQATISRLQRELAASQLQIENANVDKQRPYMAQKTLERDIFSTYYGWISYLNSQFEIYKNVQSDIPDSLVAASEGLADINSLDIKSGTISITGTSRSLDNIAAFQRACMNIKDVDDAFVSNIARSGSAPQYELLHPGQVSDEHYTFTLTATFISRNNMMKGAN